MNRNINLITLTLFFLLGSHCGFGAHHWSDIEILDPQIVSNYTIFSWKEGDRASAKYFLKIFKRGVDYKVEGIAWPSGFRAHDDWTLEFEDPKKLPELLTRLSSKNSATRFSQVPKRAHRSVPKNTEFSVRINIMNPEGNNSAKSED